MENKELTTKQPSAAELFKSQSTDVGAPNPLKDLAPQNWITSLSVAYSVSDIVKREEARAGEFIIGGKIALGKTIDIVPLDFRVHAAYVKDDFSFESEVFHLSTDPRDLENDEEYQKFIKATLPAGVKELQEGADVFCFVVDQNQYCSMFFKKTLCKFADPVYQAGKGGRVINISTLPKEWKNNSYFDIDIKKTDRALVGSTLSGVKADIAFPEDVFQKYFNMFRNPSKGIETVSEDKSSPERTR